jgi:hypothetical protein
MFYSIEMLDILAKRLAMFANGRVNSLGSEISAESPEVTGAVLSLMPHIVEKAIATSSGLSGDVSASLSERFVVAFEVIARITCNAGGFSNPIKKALFNASFHTMFSREYKKLKPIVDSAWHQARQSHVDPTEALGWCVVSYCESSGALRKLPDSTVNAVCANVRNIILDVHQMISPDEDREKVSKAESNQRRVVPKKVPSDLLSAERLKTLEAKIAATLAAFANENGIDAVKNPALALCISVEPDLVFLSTAKPTSVPFKDSLVARVLLGDLTGREAMLGLLKFRGSAEASDLSFRLLATWIAGEIVNSPFQLCAEKGEPQPEIGQDTQLQSDQPMASEDVPVISLVISCPECGKRLRVPAQKHLDIHCPKCGKHFRKFT